MVLICGWGSHRLMVMVTAEEGRVRRRLWDWHKAVERRVMKVTFVKMIQTVSTCMH